MDTDESKGMAPVCKILGTFSNEPANFHPHNYLYDVKQTEILLATNQPKVLEIDEFYNQYHHDLYWSHSPPALPAELVMEKINMLMKNQLMY